VGIVSRDPACRSMRDEKAFIPQGALVQPDNRFRASSTVPLGWFRITQQYTNLRAGIATVRSF
jgi:hypothetical protein